MPPGSSQPCCGRRGCGSRHICPISSQRSCLQKWRTCSRTTSYQRNGIVASARSSLAYPRGPCLQYCLSICGNTWTDALHAAHFELLVSSVQNQVGWSIFIVLYPGQHYVCVCASMRASILFFMALVYLDFNSHPWSTCLLLDLSLSLVC